MGLFRWIGKGLFKLSGWKLVGCIPKDIKKCVIPVAPHTCIADFIIGRLGYCQLDTDVKFLIKKEFFDNPILNWLLPKLGGIPVDRSKSNNVVNNTAALFKQYESLNLVLTPEGTRKLVHQWKRGYYYIALKANVPIILGFIDFKKKELGFGPIIYPSGDYEKDWEVIEKFYRGITAKHPERYNLS